jgi:hypothetical protein
VGINKKVSTGETFSLGEENIKSASRISGIEGSET